MLDADRGANKRRRDADFLPGVLGQPRMHRGRRVADQGFGAAQAHGELENLKSIETGEGLRLPADDLE